MSVCAQYLLEQSRIVKVAADERSYHVFYQLLAGGDKGRFLLEPRDSYAFLNQSGCYELNDWDDSKVLPSAVPHPSLSFPSSPLLQKS